MTLVQVSDTTQAHMLLASVAYFDADDAARTVQSGECIRCCTDEKKSLSTRRMSIVRFFCPGALHQDSHLGTGGAFGGFVHWIFTAVFWKHLRMCGELDYLSQEIICMAFWGLVFCIPLHNHMSNFWLRSAVFALIPTVYVLIWTLPSNDHGFLGLGLSWFSPLFAWISFWLTWSVPAYLWVGFCGYGGAVHMSLDDPTASSGDPMMMAAGAPDESTLLP